MQCGVTYSDHSLTLVVDFTVSWAEQRDDHDGQHKLRDVHDGRVGTDQVNKEHGGPQQDEANPHGEPALEGQRRHAEAHLAAERGTRDDS